MSIPEIQETTLYSEIIYCLREHGFQAIGETNISGKHPDILFELENLQFVIEVKIGDERIGAEATAQAYKYARRLNTTNVIVLIFPNEFRNKRILFQEELTRLVLHTKISCLVLTDIWTESVSLTVDDFVKTLKHHLIHKEIKIDFNTIVKLINTYITDLFSIIGNVKNNSLVDEVVKELDLFASIGEFKDKESASKQVLNLAAFLFFNQLLFYHVFNKKNQSSNLIELDEIRHIKDVQSYFDAIQDIDFRSIYKVNILGYIPNETIVIHTINNVILAIKSLRSEHITHDLAGRFFHDLIPHEVRKVLAAFYTQPNAGDLLAGLVIQNYDEKVIDPSCGSGTLLVASYKRKEELYKKLFGLSNQNEMHRKFLEEDITGIDLMPFSAHISTINLALQNVMQPTNHVRIATRDALELARIFIDISPKKLTDGIDVLTYTSTIQNLLFEANREDDFVKKPKVISAQGHHEEGFKLGYSDVVIMNPPFSDREKMPQKMKDKLLENTIVNQHSGNLVNLWGYFLVLANLLVKEDGVIGAVIPINIARGKATEKIREYLLSNQRILYIIKSANDLAFSEDSAFRDVLFVTQKTKSKETDITKIVYIKKSIRELNERGVQNLITQIKRSKAVNENLDFDCFPITYSELMQHKNNLMHFLWANSYKTYHLIHQFYNQLSKKKVKPFPKNFVRDCYNSSGLKGLIEATFITNPLNHKSRTERAFMIYEGTDEKGNIKVNLRNQDLHFKIPSKIVRKGLRTLTGIQSFEIKKKHDYFISEDFKDFAKIIMFSKVDKNKFNWNDVTKRANNKFVHLVFARRFGIYSDNTSFLAFYSDEKFITADVFKIVPNLKKKHAKILCLFYNSIINLIQVMLNQEATTGEYGCIRETDLLEFQLIDYEKLSKEEESDLLDTFQKLRKVEFPSIKEQLETQFHGRVELDSAVLKVLGYNSKEIKSLLPELYKALCNELNHGKQAV